VNIQVLATEAQRTQRLILFLLLQSGLIARELNSWSGFSRDPAIPGSRLKPLQNRQPAFCRSAKAKRCRHYSLFII